MITARKMKNASAVGRKSVIQYTMILIHAAERVM
jgi:hypothetical protein